MWVWIVCGLFVFVLILCVLPGKDKVDLKGKHVCFLTLGTINELLLILSRLLLPVVLKELENLFQVY